MHKKPCFVMLTGLLSLMTCAHAQEAPEQESVIRESQATGLLKGSIYRAWQRLRSLSPKASESQNNRQNLTATAGIRGAEQTETVLKPYWKDDRTQSPAFLAQLQAYGKAQGLIEAGQFKEAVLVLESFIKDYPDSQLLPNAWFAKGLALGANNDVQGATTALNAFIKTYPRHPMRADAEQVIAGFKN